MLSESIYDGLSLLKWLKKTGRKIPAGGEPQFFDESTPEFWQAVSDFWEAMDAERNSKEGASARS